jgi:hypothetical protein
MNLIWAGSTFRAFRNRRPGEKSKVAPKPKFDLNKVACDLETVRIVRLHIALKLTGYARDLEVHLPR